MINKKAKKITIIISSVIAFILIACLIGLIVTGAKIGWGPFDFIKWNNVPQYVLSEQEYSYAMEDRFVYNHDEKIVGTLYKPNSDKEKQPIVIVSHGYGSGANTNAYVCKSLARSGICVYSFDYRGGAIKSRSEGKSTNMSVLTEKEDLDKVIDEVKTWDFVDIDKIYVMGFSQGGLVASLTASERTDINKLLLVFPAFYMIEEINRDYKTVDEIPNKVHRLGMDVGKNYFADILNMDYDIYEKIADYEGEVLIIHGTADVLVPYSSSEKANEAYKNCELFPIEGAGHGFAGTEYDYPAMVKMYEFFSKG